MLLLIHKVAGSNLAAMDGYSGTKRPEFNSSGKEFKLWVTSKIFQTPQNPLPVPHPPWCLLSKTVTWRHPYCVFTYIYFYWLRRTSVIAETHQLSFHVFMFAFHRKISSFFSVKVFSFFSYFCVFHSSVLSLSTWSQFY